MKFSRIVAVDPGPEESAFTIYLPDEHDIADMNIVGNKELLQILRQEAAGGPEITLAIEMIASYGMTVGKSTFDTCVWIGRFEQCWLDSGGETYSEIFRREAKLALCQHPRAKDKNIRRAVIDRFGGEKKGIGNVKCPKCKGKGWFGRGRPTCPECDGSGYKVPPGPLADAATDMWASTAVALTFADAMEGIEELERAYALEEFDKSGEGDSENV